MFISTDIRDICRAADRWDGDPTAVAEFVHSGRVGLCDPGRTFVAGVRQVPAGHRVEFMPSGADHTGPFWAPEGGADYRALPYHKAVDKLRHALTGAVRAGIGDGRVGVFFSGGIDSSALAGLASTQRPDQPVFLLGFHHAYVSATEQRLAEEFVKGSGWFERIELPPAAPGLYEPLLRLNTRTSAPKDGLFAGFFAALAAEAAGRGIDVVLSGNSGDAVAGSYPALVGDLLGRRSYAAAFDAYAWFASTSGRPSWRYLVSRWQGERATTPECHLVLEEAPADPSVELTQEARRTSRRAGLLGCDWERIRELRHTVANGLEGGDFLDPEAAPVRVVAPLNSPGVLEAVLSLRPEECVTTAPGFTDKQILRDAVRGVVPESVRRHRKTGRMDLLSLAVTPELDRFVAATESESLTRLGLRIRKESRDPRRLPAGVGGTWLSVISLGMWFDGLQAFRRSPAPAW